MSSLRLTHEISHHSFNIEFYQAVKHNPLIDKLFISNCDHKFTGTEN